MLTELPLIHSTVGPLGPRGRPSRMRTEPTRGHRGGAVVMAARGGMPQWLRHTPTGFPATHIHPYGLNGRLGRIQPSRRGTRSLGGGGSRTIQPTVVNEIPHAGQGRAKIATTRSMSSLYSRSNWRRHGLGEELPAGDGP